MMYRVCFYDRYTNELLCWYSTGNKAEAEKYMRTKLSKVKMEILEYEQPQV